MTDRIPEEDLKRARRKLARRVGACIVAAMAEYDFNFTQIASRINKTEKEISAWMTKLFDGDGSGAMLDHVSDILLAMGCELDISTALRPVPPSPQESASE